MKQITHIVQYIIYILICVYISSCGNCGGGSLPNKVVPTPTPTPTPLPRNNDIMLTVLPHGDTDNYVSNLSDTPYYIAIKVTSITGTNTITNLNLTNSVAFEISTTQSNYPTGTTICTDKTQLNESQSCELMIKLNQPKIWSNESGDLTITTESKANTIELKKTQIAYVAGDFSATYDTNPTINLPATANNYCGPNGDSPCAILEYDLTNNTVKDIANTNASVNAITLDNNGILYVGGNFNQASLNNNTISIPNISTTDTRTFILEINPAIESDLHDFLSRVGVTTYPDSNIYAMDYNNNKLYLTGGFQQIANLSSNLNYLFVNYDFNSNSWNDIFGVNNDPNYAITTMAFDQNNNLYISGYYTSVSNFINLTSNYYSINKCEPNGTLYLCDDTPNNYTYIDSSLSNQPATSINFDDNYNLFVTGGFSAIGHTITTNNNQYQIVKLNNPYNNTGFNQSLAVSDTTANRTIGVITPLNNNLGYFVGGWFSSIGGLPINNNESGECGLGPDIYTNGVNSCMLANYDTQKQLWSRVFTTNGIINTFTPSTKITAVIK